MIIPKPVTRLGAGLLLLAATAITSVRAQASRPPNVILIFCDDLGYGDVSAFGQTKFQTPNIDKLASEGMKVMTHYAGNAVCAASRCSMLSSLHPGHTYIRGKMEYGRAVGQDSIAAGAGTGSDVAAGQKLGAEIARRLLANPGFQAQLAQAKDECLD